MSQSAPSTDSPYLIVGLGNPGPRYAHTRHNIGFMAVEEIARRHSLRFAGGQANSEVAKGSIKGRRVILAKPQTYMNESGRAVQTLSHFYKVPKDQVVVIYDDFALPLGVLRVREKGSSGGHNGLESIIRHLGTQAFPRIRIGVDQPPGGRHSHIDWVLSRFSKEEQPVVQEAVERATAAVESIFEIGIERTMNFYNVKRGGDEGRKTKDGGRESRGQGSGIRDQETVARGEKVDAVPAAETLLTDLGASTSTGRQPAASSWIDRAIRIVKGEGGDR